MNRPPREWNALLTPSEGAPPPSISDQELLAGLWTLEHQLNTCIIRMDRFQHPEIKRHQRELRAVAVKVTGIRLGAAQVLRIDPRHAGQEVTGG